METAKSTMGSTVALSEEQRSFLLLYHRFLRARGNSVCERMRDGDGAVRHRMLRLGRGTDLIGDFELWLQGQQEASPEQDEAKGGTGDGTHG